MLCALCASNDHRGNKISCTEYSMREKFRTLAAVNSGKFYCSTMLILLVTLTVFITSGLIFLVKLGASRK